ncbi:hypothetical protein ABW19_dt0206221 [Dactylella cylindrospora]|nr:hypothetical protein ABW19_dt0206221 [Dactylella cylindrospora]
MARGRREAPRNRWILPAALTLTAAVATAGVYFWKEMEDHEAAAGFRSEDEETADEKRRSRGMAAMGSRSFGDSAVAAGAGITSKVSEIWKGFFEGGSSSDESDSGRSKGRGGPSMSGARPSSSSSSNMPRSGAASRSMPVPVLGNSQEVDWEKKKIVALVISSYEDLDESLLLSLPTPVDISRWILLIFVYAPPPPPSPSLVQLSPRPMHRSPSPAISVKSYTSSKSFARTQPSPPDLSPETSPSLVPILRTPATSGRTSRADGLLLDEDELLLTPSLTSSRPRTSSFSRKSSQKGYSSASDAERGSSNPIRRFGSFRSSRRDESDLDLESEETSVENSATMAGLILKTFGRDFPHQQVMHYSTPTGVVHMLRHLGVSLVFLSESCASVPGQDNSSADEAPANIPGGLPMSPPPGGVNAAGGGEIVGMLKDWVGEIILVLDEDEDDSAPIRPSAVSGGEDNYEDRRRRKGKDRHHDAVGEGTGRKRRWLKDKSLGRGITICDRQGLKGIWRAKVEGAR